MNIVFYITESSVANISNNASDSSNNATESGSQDPSKSPAVLSQDTEALLGMALETYGRLLLGDRRLSEAVPIFQRALTIAEKVLGREHDQSIVLMNDLATAHILLKEYPKATQVGFTDLNLTSAYTHCARSAKSSCVETCKSMLGLRVRS